MLLRAFIFTAAIAVLSHGISGQSAEDIPAKHASYFRCINNIEAEPVRAYQFCTSYLKTYPNDDQRLTEFAGRFVSAYEKIDRYLRSISEADFIDGNDWSVFKPDLSEVIPVISETDDAHKIEISRLYNSPEEERLLSRAEAVYRPRKPLNIELFKQWKYIGEPGFQFPDGEPRWWSGKPDGILATEIVTVRAVRYYIDVSRRMRSERDELKEAGFRYSSSGLKYVASIDRLPRYEHGGKTFSDVYVATMTLAWGEVCGSLCGSGFTRKKVVVLDKSGEILALFLDDPENGRSWIS
jgi:hypothetical protein